MVLHSLVVGYATRCHDDRQCSFEAEVMDREIIVAVVVGNQCCASLLSLGDDAVLLVYLNGGIAQCRFFPLCDSIVVTDDTCTWAQGNLVRFVLPPLMLFVYESHHQLSSGRFHPRNLLLRD